MALVNPTPLEKEYPHTVIDNMRAKFRRTQREVQSKESRVALQEKDLKRQEDALQAKENSMLEAMDNKNELIIRLVESKLEQEKLSDRRAALREEISKLRAETYEQENDLSVLQCSRDEWYALLIQEENETHELQRLTSGNAHEAQQIAQEAQNALKVKKMTEEELFKEKEDIQLAEYRLRLMNEAVREIAGPQQQQQQQHRSGRK